MTRTYSHSDPDAVRSFAIEAARTIADLKCTDVVVLDVHGQSQVCDYIVIGSGTSQRQMRSLADEVADLGKTMGMRAFRTNRDDGTTWIVVDFVEVVVHLFEPDQRLYYDLELMWSQAKRVDWARKADAKAAGKPDVAASAKGEKPAAKKTGKVAAKAPAKEVAMKAPAKKAATKASGAKSSAASKKTASRGKKRAAGDED